MAGSSLPGVAGHIVPGYEGKRDEGWQFRPLLFLCIQFRMEIPTRMVGLLSSVKPHGYSRGAFSGRF